MLYRSANTAWYSISLKSLVFLLWNDSMKCPPHGLWGDFPFVPPICGSSTTPKRCSHSPNFPILEYLSPWVMRTPPFTFTHLNSYGKISHVVSYWKINLWWFFLDYHRICFLEFCNPGEVAWNNRNAIEIRARKQKQEGEVAKRGKTLNRSWTADIDTNHVQSCASCEKGYKLSKM